MKKIYISLIASLLFLNTSSDNPGSSQLYFFNYEDILGTSFMLKLTATSAYAASKAEEAALGEIERLADILNTYDPESEFSRWQKTYNTDIPVSSELFEVMSLFDKWQSKTDGALNAAIGTASELWKRADETDSFPEKEELQKAVNEMHKNHWALNEENMTARHLTTNPLVFNTFVKSYIISKASDAVMDVDGITSSIVNIGGDIVAKGDIQEKIDVADPVRFADNKDPLMAIEISGKAVATSGNYKKGFTVGDEWYSHILDARTALPASEIISATVVSEDAATAGALATAFNILPPEESRNLARQVPGLEFLIITRDGRLIESEGWDNLKVKTERKTIPNTIAKGFELNIELELTRFQGRSLRPYVAVWVENENSESIRTLALWFNNNRWLPDLRRWYAKHYEKTQQYDFMQTITSATRSPGKYNLKWDLTDDIGQTVDHGKYTVYIEASREHGTYQLIRKEIQLNEQPQSLDIEGGIEISSAILNYKKVEYNEAANY